MTSIHQKFLQRIQQDNKIQLLFLGDSITANWNRPENQATWNKYFGQYDPANFGDGGDYTEHLLWRIDNGELDGISPKVVVLLIGVNNIYHNPGNTPEETAAGVKKILDTIHEKLPQTRVILLGLFPYNRGPGSLEKAQAVNSIISKFDDGQKTRYLSIWDQFLVGGAVTKDHTMDLLHPNASGYQIWADTMQPLLEELMK